VRRDERHTVMTTSISAGETNAIVIRLVVLFLCGTVLKYKGKSNVLLRFKSIVAVQYALST